MNRLQTISFVTVAFSLLAGCGSSNSTGTPVAGGSGVAGSSGTPGGGGANAVAGSLGISGTPPSSGGPGAAGAAPVTGTSCTTLCAHTAAPKCPNDKTQSQCESSCAAINGLAASKCPTQWEAYKSCVVAATLTCSSSGYVNAVCNAESQANSDCLAGKPPSGAAGAGGNGAGGVAGTGGTSACTSASLEATAFTVKTDPGTPPLMTGGTILDGRYWLTDETRYGASTGATTQQNQIDISGNGTLYQEVSYQASLKGNLTVGYSCSLSGIEASCSITCSSLAAIMGTAVKYTYTATATELRFVSEAKDRMLVYTKK